MSGLLRHRMLLLNKSIPTEKNYIPVEYLTLRNMFVPIRGYSFYYTDKVTLNNQYEFRWPVDNEEANELQCAMVIDDDNTQVPAYTIWLRWFSNMAGMTWDIRPPRPYVCNFEIQENQCNSAEIPDGDDNIISDVVNTNNPITQFGINEELGDVCQKDRSRNYGYISIERDGQLILNAIPALDANNQPCYVNTVDNRFFYPEGSGTVTAGPVIE